MAKQVTAELWVAMNEDGDWVVVTNESEALRELAEQWGAYATRVVKVSVTMTPPVVTEVTVAVPDEDESAVAEAGSV